jgi:hypothetical protein
VTTLFVRCPRCDCLFADDTSLLPHRTAVGGCRAPGRMVDVRGRQMFRCSSTPNGMVWSLRGSLQLSRNPPSEGTITS